MKKKILILSANPKNSDKLRLDEEVREIRAALKRSKGREQFEVITESAVRVEDLLPTLLDHEPDIVHFSGHGAGTQGLALENNSGKVQLVSTAALARLFKAFRTKIQCVFLNACYSEAQAETIHQHIDYVVGMNKAIGDRAAIEFAVGFYTVIFSGRAYEEAFELGCTSIDLEGIPESETPTFRANPRSLVLGENESVRVEATSSNVAEEKLSAELEVKVARVFISYRSQEPNQKLAQEFHDALEAAGHDAFMAGESIRLGENWPQRIDAELEQCDYFLLLLSPQSAVSEMVTEEVRRAKQLRDQRSEKRPKILPIRVNFPMSSPLNYDLRGYLQQIQQREWTSPEDTTKILREVLDLIEESEEWADNGEKTPDAASSTLAVDTIDTPPMPVAEPELYREPGGSVPLDSGLYVTRPPIEFDCYTEILQPGALIRIKAPQQMGKTSLMIRILNHAQKCGCRTIPLSFQRANSKIFTDLDLFLRWFCEQVGQRLKRREQLEKYWQGYSSKDNCNAYFEECLLEEIDSPIVLGLDEIDLIFPHREVADDFFSLLRSWYESSRYGDPGSELWAKLRVVVVHSTETYVPMNLNQSPLNVGKNVELPMFGRKQMQPLAQYYGVKWTESQVDQLVNLVGGNPYLAHKVIHHVYTENITLDELVRSKSSRDLIFGSHLKEHLRTLLKNPLLLETIRQIVLRDKPLEVDAESAFKLESMGLIKLEGNKATFSCTLYKMYFHDYLKT